MTNQNLYVDINVLQTVPSSNINRDDTGAPKTAVYGGVTRSRVSSQSWKRAVRLAFAKQSEDADWLSGIRTTRGPELLAKQMQKLSVRLSNDDAMKKAVAVFNTAKIKLDKKTNRTKALLMLSRGQIEKLAQYALDNDEMIAKDVKAALKQDHSLDMALFGRMVADDPALNVDAACQVAHAISTHEIVPEFDYYTAIDDEQTDGEAGAAMINTTEYDSSTLYRYANVNVNELMHNLGDQKAVIEGLKLFIKDFIMTMPTGKQNSFANKTLPQYVMIAVRSDTPVNLVSAFETPVKSHDGYVQTSIDRLEDEEKQTQRFIEQPVMTEVLTNNKTNMENTADNLNDLVDSIAKTVESGLENENLSD